MRIRFLVSLLLCLGLVAVGCGDEASITTSKGSADTGADVGQDVGQDAGADTSPDPDIVEGCTNDEDCEGGTCDTNTGECIPDPGPTCDDGIQNGNETDVDCGGDCEACGDGAACTESGDCISGVCLDDICQAPTCDDGAQNGSETDVDCGGDCDACDDGSQCVIAADCTSGVCDPDASLCVAASCGDGELNGTETDVDCGGDLCAPCGAGLTCNTADDCGSGVCTDSVCQAPTCNDGVQNGDETGTDCGGSCEPCADGGGCDIASDCTSGVCTNDLCQAPTCNDGVQNGDETGTDCGASCGPCADGGGCAIASDCESGVCTDDICQAPTCNDGVQNGAETDTDCGGSCGPCADGGGCSIGGDCASGVCTSSVCQVPTCGDGVQNGSETDIDCGGPSCQTCGDGEGCLTGDDCASGYCENNQCFMPQSCSQLIELGLANATGTYVIDPDGPGPIDPLEVHCDFDADRGVGYTMVRLDDNELLGVQSAYRDACEAIGMEVIVPRTRAHAQAIMDFNNDTPPNLVNVFPKFNGAQGLHNWQGICQGQPCSFFMDDSNNAQCDGFEPNGDNTTETALYRFQDGCFFGKWNDLTTPFVHIQGSVICSPNDVGPELQATCLDYRVSDSVHNAGPTGINGVYTLSSQSDPYDAYCDMTTQGGGWTLAVKVDGRLQTFTYGSALWTNTDLLNANQPDLDRTEAKLQSFNELPFTQILAGLETPIGNAGLPNMRWLSMPADGQSLQSVFSTNSFVPTNLGRASWKELVAGSSLQLNCNREGLNNIVDGFTGARIGILGNQENDCNSPDSRIGIGTAGTTCGQTNFSAGNSAGCSPDNGDLNTPSIGAVLVRDVPVFSSCQELFDAGFTRPGTYPISINNGAPVNTLCGDGVNAFGEFRPALRCEDFVNRGPSYQRYCFQLHGQWYCTGQHDSGRADCENISGGIRFTYDFPTTWPMRFTADTQNCENYHPQHLQNFSHAIGYSNFSVTETKTGNSCPRTWLDGNGAFQSMGGDTAQALPYVIEYTN